MITVSEVMQIHEWVVESTGGSAGLRDEGLLISALRRGDMTFDGNELYPTIEEKITAISHSLISNHCFVDGNKRIGVVVLLVLAETYDIELDYTQNELIELGLEVASGVRKEKEILNWILTHKK